MEELRREWGKNIRRHRRAFDWTQLELAEKCGVSRVTVVMWETGNRSPSDDHKMKLAEQLHADVREMFPLIRMSA